jgi:acetyltransferase-like isoleucine patch superfamily enzyme
MRKFHSHGSGRFALDDLGALGEGVVLEDGVLIFGPEHVRFGDNVYVGHRAMLKAYPDGGIVVGRDTWIGPDCSFSGAATIHIGAGVGIGPGVQILTSTHVDPGPDRPIMEGELERAEVHIGDGSDLGVGCILLPGATLGRGVQIGAGAVVSGDVPDLAVAAGVPARVLRFRGEE